MNAWKIAVAGLGAGLILAVAGLMSGSGGATTETPAAVSVASLQPLTGLAPIEEVVELFEERSQRQPLDYLSRTQLGIALNAQAREQADREGYERAEAVFREALAINPRHAPAELGLASALHSQHRFDEASSIARRLLDADPGSLAALALVGDAAFESGDYETAAAAYDQLSATERSAAAVSRLARLQWVRGDHAGTLALVEEALGLGEGEPLRPNGAAFYWFQLGHFRFEVGDVDGAVTALERARRIDPGNPAATERLAFVLTAIGDDEAAAPLYEELLAAGGAADIHGAYADLLRRRGDEATAAEHDQLGWRAAEETVDRFPAERRHLVGFHLDRDPATAVRLAELDLATRTDVGAHDTLAWALYHAGDHERAAAHMELALAEGTRSASLLYHAGAIAAANGDDAAARDLLDQALALNPTFHPTDAPAAATLLADLSTT